MQIFSLACLYLALLLPASFTSPVLTSRTISTPLYDDFILYTKYSSAAYQLFCLKPVGKTLVKSFEFGRTQGFIARDHETPGNRPDCLSDAKILLVPFESPGIVELVHVHGGFLAAYTNVAEDVVSIVEAKLKQYPTFRIVVTGHSLGGAIASLAAPSIKAALPDATLVLYTFGQPRVGNAKFARYVERVISQDNNFRDTFPACTRNRLTDDMPSQPVIEYWQFKDSIPLIALAHETVKKCIGNENPTCCASITVFSFPSLLSFLSSG
ncbi:Alpha/Beta hydrolase protein [Mycena capillaripes]|nr:Alpha/Beta hydrolase protein [Mycena capillaripes]